MRWLLYSLFLLVAPCCTRCSPTPPAEFDAGVRQVRRSIDLRTALIQAYPEYRQTAVLEAQASVARVIPGLTAALRDEALSKLKYQRSDAGTGWDLNKFHLEQTAHDKLVVSLELSAEELGQVYLAPAGLSSMEMALYLPRHLPVGQETFELNLRYSSSPQRCRALIRQAVTLLEASQQWRVSRAPPTWGADAALDEELPENFDVELTSLEGARLTYRRTRGQVRVKYALETVSPPQ